MFFQGPINGSGGGDLSAIVDDTTHLDDVKLQLGDSDDAALEWDTGQTNDALLVGVSGSHNVVMCQVADMGTDFGHAASTNPTLFIQSADAASPTDYISFFHDQTDGTIDVGSGDLNVSFAGTAAITMTSGQIGAPDGNSSSPGLSFLDGPFGGVFRSGHEVGIAPNGIPALMLALNMTSVYSTATSGDTDLGKTASRFGTTYTTDVVATSTVLAGDGLVTAPAFGFESGGSGGVYKAGNSVALTYNGSGGLVVGNNLIVPIVAGMTIGNEAQPWAQLFLELNAIGEVSTDSETGLLLANTTAAALGAQQNSPMFVMEGQGWKSAATAETQEVQFAMQVVPVENDDEASGDLTFFRNINDGGFARIFSIGHLTPSTTPSTNPYVQIGDANAAYSGSSTLAFKTNSRTATIELQQSGGIFHFTPVSDANGFQFGASAGSILSMTSSAVTSAAPFLAPDGSASAPGLSFSGLPGGGVWRGGNEVGLSPNGTSSLKVAATAVYDDATTGTIELGLTSLRWQKVWTVDVDASGQFLAADGNGTTPGYSFADGPSQGLFRVNTTTLRMNPGSAGSNREFYFTTSFFAGGVTSAQDLGTDTTKFRSLYLSTSIDLDQVVSTGAPQSIFDITSAAHTALTASTERSEFLWDLSATQQFATGAITDQRAIKILAPTYGFVGASTITNVATFYIDAAPSAGTNATFTNTYAFWVDAGAARFDGTINASAGTAALPSIIFEGDPDTGIWSGASDEITFATGGTERCRMTTSFLAMSSGYEISITAGDATTPGLRSSVDADTGVFMAIGAVSLTAAGTERLQVDDDATATFTSLLIYDVDNATLERVSVGAADSGGTNFKLLRIAN